MVVDLVSAGHRVGTGAVAPSILQRVHSLEDAVGALGEQMTVVVDCVAVHEERFRDVQSEMQHYSTMASNVTQHLSEHRQRQNLVFQGMAFFMVGLLFWLVSRVT